MTTSHQALVKKTWDRSVTGINKSTFPEATKTEVFFDKIVSLTNRTDGKVDVLSVVAVWSNENLVKPCSTANFFYFLSEVK